MSKLVAITFAREADAQADLPFEVAADRGQRIGRRAQGGTVLPGCPHFTSCRRTSTPGSGWKH